MAKPQAVYYKDYPTKRIVLEAQMRAEGWQDLKIAHYYEPIIVNLDATVTTPDRASRPREHRATRRRATRAGPSEDPSDPPASAFQRSHRDLARLSPLELRTLAAIAETRAILLEGVAA